MASVVQFSWSRLEGIGLIITALGISIISQLPLVYFAFTLLFLDFTEFFIAMVGTFIGTTIILATISCSITEDWNELVIPSMKRIASVNILFAIIYFVGFFSFFLVEPLFPPEMSDLTGMQRYFSATTLALIVIGITTILAYRGRRFFRD